LLPGARRLSAIVKARGYDALARAGLKISSGSRLRQEVNEMTSDLKSVPSGAVTAAALDAVSKSTLDGGHGVLSLSLR
jgi:hypothetical protein